MKFPAFVFALFLFSSLAFAQEKRAPSEVVTPAIPEALLKQMAPKTFTAKNGVTLPYRLFVPEGAAKNPLPLFLAMHGAGGRGNDNLKTIKHSPWALHSMMAKEVQAKNPCIVLAPQCPNGKRWVDVNWNKCVYSTEDIAITPEQTAAVELLDTIVKETRADAKRVYVGGFSMGGYGTWDIAARFPDRFAAAVPVCGGAPPNRAAAMKDVAVWAFHGDKDGVVPPRGTREMIAALKEAGASPKYTELAGVSHNAWTPAWKRADLISWIFEQSK